MTRTPRRLRVLFGFAITLVLVVSACTDLEAEPTTSSLPGRDQPPAPPTTTTLPPKPGEVPIFYAKGGRIHVSEDARSPGKPVSDGPYDGQPAPSPDGSQVAFVRSAGPNDPGGELWVVNTDGTNPERLVYPELLPVPIDAVAPYVRSPRWSPDGEKIAFVVPGELEGGLLVVAEAASGALREMAPPPQAADLFAWSPDGSQIAFMSAPTDVSPIMVGTMDAETGETSEGVGSSNATGVAWTEDAAVLFSNAPVPGEMATRYEPAVGGIYEIASRNEVEAVVAQPEVQYADPAVVAASSGESVAYTSRSADPAVRTLSLWRVDVSLSPAPQLLAEGLVAASPATAWNSAGEVAYLLDEQRRILTAQATNPDDADQRAPRMIDEGVTSFAWPPQSLGAAAADIPPQ